MVLKFADFLLLEKIKIKKKKKQKPMKKSPFAKELDKRRRQIAKRWVCLLVTNRTRNDFEQKYPGVPFDINLGSHRMILNTEGQFEQAKIKYQIGNVYKGELIEDVNFHPFNPLIDNVLFGR